MDVAALASRLRALAADLPAPGVDTADAHLETALAELAEAARESNTDVGLHRLGAAREHLAAARTRLTEAGEAVDDYLESIGASGPAAPAPAGPASAPVRKAAPVDPRRWWTDRVNELCERTGNGAPTPRRPPNCSTRCSAPPATATPRTTTGSCATRAPAPAPNSPAWPGPGPHPRRRAPRPRPHRARRPLLRSRTADRVRALVPGAAEPEVEAALASACTLRLPDRDGDERDAAATAAVGPALVAALHLLGKSERKVRPK
ncbi:hypothetical protein GCM10029992_23530 [Glycomyces albus]